MMTEEMINRSVLSKDLSAGRRLGEGGLEEAARRLGGGGVRGNNRIPLDAVGL